MTPMDEGRKLSHLITGASPASALARLLGSISLIVLVNHFLEVFHVEVSSLLGDDKALTLAVVVIVILLLELVYTRSLLGAGRQRALVQVDPRIGFADAAVEYAAHLEARQKNRTVLALRSSLSRLFHLMGLHSHRIRLGQIALSAATRVNDPLLKAEIFLDDLGWAEHMNNNRPGALHNIRHALTVASAFEPKAAQQQVSKALLQAKACRHLAMLADGPESQAYLEKANAILAPISDADGTSEVQREEVVRDQAQLLHAEAALIARALGVETTGRIAAADPDNVRDLGHAIECAERAESAFEEIGDVERQSKALDLLERLYDAGGNEPMVLESSAKRRHLLQISSIDRDAI